MNAKKLLVSTLLIGSLAVGGGAALAQDGSADGATPAGPPAVGAWGRFGGPGGPAGRGFHPQPPGGPRGQGGRFGRGLRMGPELMDLALEYTGLSLTELRQALREGQTLAELIEANGQSVDAFVEAATAAISARIDERLAEQAERAEELKAALPDRISALVHGERPGTGADSANAE
jgi:hypothetical protein